MTNLKLSSKMHLFIIITSVLVAAGIAVGLVFNFVFGGYFNFGSEYASYNSVVVDYAYIDYGSEDAVREICDKAFDAAGVKYYSTENGETGEGGEFIFKFAKSVNTESIQKAVGVIHSEITKGDVNSLSHAYFHNVKTKMGGAPALKFGAIALASAIAFQFLYFVIRYRLTMAFAALLANVHNLAIYVSLLAITRVPFGSSAIAFGALTVLTTMIGCCLLFDRMRKNLKEESFAKRGVGEQVDICAGESILNVSVLSVFIAASALIMFVFLSISALSVAVVMTPVFLAVLSAVASIYGTAFFTPSVYARFKTIGDNYKAAHGKKSKKA